MFDRIASLAAGSGQLLRVEGQMLLSQARKGLIFGGVAILGGLAVVAALAGLVVAAGIALAQSFGIVWGIAGVSLVVLAFGLAVAAFANRRLAEATRPSSVPTELRLQEEESKRLLAGEQPAGGRERAAMSQPTPRPSEQPSATWQDKVAGFAVENPGVALGGAVAVVALVGPWRTLKLLGRGAMIAGLASSAIKEATEAGRQPRGSQDGSTKSPAAAGAHHSKERA